MVVNYHQELKNLFGIVFWTKFGSLIINEVEKDVASEGNRQVARSHRMAGVLNLCINYVSYGGLDY